MGAGGPPRPAEFFGSVSCSLAASTPSIMGVPCRSLTTSLCSVPQVSVSLAKDEPDTNLVALMKEEGAKLLREAMGVYISTLKTGICQMGAGLGGGAAAPSSGTHLSRDRALFPIWDISILACT